MIRQFENLTNEETERLLKAPVLLSLLAACSFNSINKTQKADAIKLAHIKTFSSTPLLIPYYNKVNENFKKDFEEAQEKYFPFDPPKQNLLKKELDSVNNIIAKLDKDYGKALHESLDGYARHVKKAAHTVFQDFVFPLALPKFSG